MAVKLPGVPSLHGIARDGVHNIIQDTLDVPQHCRSNWYLSRKDIEDHSPSRKDGIDLKRESQLRKLYCSFIQDLGMKLKVPQVTIATATMFCHRFYLRQSHARNEWQTIATVSMFLAGKVEEAPRLLMDVVVVAYETMYRRDPAAAQRIKQKEIYEKQKELILIGERMLLQTIGFDFNIQHPYKPLVAALKKFKISHKELAKMAWNFVNDWLRTTLCLQYKHHYIAAGSIFLAAKYYKVKLPSERGNVWWQEFDVTPRQLEEVIQQMYYYLEQNRKTVAPCAREKVILTPLFSQKAASTSPQSCVLSGSADASNSSHVVDREVGAKIQPIEKPMSPGKVDAHCQVSDSGSTNSIIEDGERCGEVEEQATESDQIPTSKIVTVCVGLSEVDKDRIKATLKRRRWAKALNKKRLVVMGECEDEDEDGEAWIERELENGIELGVESMEKKKQRLV